MDKTFLEELKERRATYREMIDFCCDSLILNNNLIELEGHGYYFDTFCGELFEYFNEDWENITKEEYEQLNEKGAETHEQPVDIYQYYIISENDAERLSDYTNELVLYNDDLDLYLLCVCHYGTSWNSVPANWKDEEDA